MRAAADGNEQTPVRCKQIKKRVDDHRSNNGDNLQDCHKDGT